MGAAAWVMVVAALLIGCAEKPEALVASAKELLAKKDRNAAVIQLKNALQIDPDLGEARYLLGKSQFDAGDMAAAEKDLRKARELKVPDNLVVPLLARTLVAQRQFKKALDDYGNVELTTPEARAELAVALAQAQIGTGNVDAARAGFSSALKAVPGYPPAMLGEAGLKAANGDLPGASAQVDTALATSPDLLEGWMMKGELASAQRETETALAAYRKLLELRPDALAARMKVALILIQQGKNQEADAQVDAMKKIAPNDPRTTYLLALIAVRDKNYAAAREPIQLNLRAAPDNLQGLLLAANIDYHLGSYLQAEEHLKKVLREAPNQPLPRMMLVNTYLRSREPAKALETLRPLLDEPNPSAEVLTLAGQVYLQNGKTKDAERVLARASALDPKDPVKRTTLALSHMSSGETDRGMKELEETAAADAGTRADLALISANFRQRKYDAALKAIAALEKKQPDKPLPHNLRGAVYVAKGDIGAARQSFERALALDPADFGAAASLARLDVGDKKPEDAQKRFDTILAKDPKNARAYLAMAEMRRLSGGTADQVAALINKAVAADPTNVSPRLVLIQHYLRIKEPKKAVAAAQEARAALPNHPELLDVEGRAQLAAGDASQAIAAFQKLAELRPNEAEPYVQLAGAQIAAKDPDAALQSLQRAVQIKPGDPKVQLAIVKLNLQAGRVADALAIARGVQRQRPKESAGYVLEGDIHASKKAWAEAEAAYRNGLKQVATSDLAVRLDLVLRASGNASGADKFMAGWLRDHPKDRLVSAYMAEVAVSKKDFSAAARHYKVMLEIQPNDALALNNLAYVSGNLKDPKALEYAEKASRIAPDNPAILDTLGMLLLDKGDAKRGIAVLQKAAALAPNSAPIHLNLARALIRDGQKEAARKELDRLAELGDKFAGQSEVAKLKREL
jgi:putative PEP-CTERM system TPR-repeat lipoprotein